MIDSELSKHAGEFKHCIDNHKYECSPEGIFFPGANALIFGEYIHSSNGKDARVDHNLITTEGINHLLNVGLSNDRQQSMWFLAIYKGSYTPVASLTATQFPTVADEIVSPTEGYSEMVRPRWIPDPANAGSIENVTNKATYTIVSNSSISIVGAAVVSEQVKGASTGILLSASRFAFPREQYAGDTFSLGYRVRVQPA